MSSLRRLAPVLAVATALAACTSSHRGPAPATAATDAATLFNCYGIPGLDGARTEEIQFFVTNSDSVPHSYRVTAHAAADFATDVVIPDVAPHYQKKSFADVVVPIAQDGASEPIKCTVSAAVTK